jgi:hypothetical protein
MSNHSIESKPVCSFECCGRPCHAKGLCDPHYQQRCAGKELNAINSTQRKRGGQPRIICDEAICEVGGLHGNCHVFRGAKKIGYGQVRFLGKIIPVHRYIWELEIGPIPEGLVIDHICRNRACCNTDHLRVVTRSVNSSENIFGTGWQINLAKTHCPQKHEYTEENMGKIVDKNGAVHRYCRLCKKKQSDANYRLRIAKRRS